MANDYENSSNSSNGSGSSGEPCDIEAPVVTAGYNRNEITITAPSQLPNGATLTLQYKFTENGAFVDYATDVIENEQIHIFLEKCRTYYFAWVLDLP